MKPVEDKLSSFLITVSMLFVLSLSAHANTIARSGTHSYFTDPVTDNDYGSKRETLSSTERLENPAHASETVVMQNREDQEAQKVAPSSDFDFDWAMSTLFFGIAIGIIYVVRKRNDVFSSRNKFSRFQ